MKVDELIGILKDIDKNEEVRIFVDDESYPICVVDLSINDRVEINVNKEEKWN